MGGKANETKKKREKNVKKGPDSERRERREQKRETFNLYHQELAERNKLSR